MSHCGHQCCEIPSNGYHAHTEPPSNCGRCEDAGEDMSVSEAGAGQGRESAVLGRLVADVVARVAPQIPGLPAETELTEIVASHALAVYAAGLVDPDLQILGERDRRTVLAARVGLALAFPAVV
jgi:hypothetical protein